MDLKPKEPSELRYGFSIDRMEYSTTTLPWESWPMGPPRVAKVKCPYCGRWGKREDQCEGCGGHHR